MRKKIYIWSMFFVLAAAVTCLFAQSKKFKDDPFVTYSIDAKKQNVGLYWKDDKEQLFKSIENLKSWLHKNHKRLLFATNGGMFKQDNSPQGLFVENQKIITALDTANGIGNFYLKPNGVFYITVDNIPYICNTNDFSFDKKIKYATQSGPMLVFNGQIHSAFRPGSSNINIRNGVGILPDGRVVFAMSKKQINFYDFANYFKKLGCKNALYLDGFVSRTYLPAENWEQTDGNFGVIIGVVADYN